MQNQRLAEQKIEGSKLDVKLNFDKELAEIQGKDLNQKEKQGLIFAAARKRDEGLQGDTVTNTQFEQSRAGFAASRTNITSGETVRLVQDFIDIARKRRRLGGKA